MFIQDLLLTIYRSINQSINPHGTHVYTGFIINKSIDQSIINQVIIRSIKKNLPNKKMNL